MNIANAEAWDSFYEAVKPLGLPHRGGVIFTRDGNHRAAWKDDGELGPFLRVSSGTPHGEDIEVAARTSGISVTLTNYVCGGEPGLGPDASM